ncbi:MAG: hypothetical protein QXV01_08070 [Candidatus Bathyarchaeia archaeon]
MESEPIKYKPSENSNQVTRTQNHTILSKSSYLVTFSQILEQHYNRKFGQKITPIAILKTLSVISSNFKDNAKLWVLHVAPSRQLKSQTSNEQAKIFPKKRLIYLGSDQTIHSIIKNYGNTINGKCLLINDLTLLLSSKALRAKSRLINALSELYSEGIYTYSDFQQNLTLKAQFSLIANITPKSLFYNRKDTLGNTFLERCIVVYSQLTDQEMAEANLNREEKQALRPPKFKQTLHERDVKISKEDLVRLNEYAKRWRILGAYTSSSQTFDIIKSIATAYAILSGHITLTSEEYRYLDMLEPHIRNPFENVKLTILEFAFQGRSVKDICLLLNRDYDKYHPYVSRVLNEYRREGVLPAKENM